MIKMIHLFSAFMWLINAVLWAFYAKHFGMSVVSIAMVAWSIMLAKLEQDAWR